MSNIGTVSDEDDELFEADLPKRMLYLILILPATIILILMMQVQARQYHHQKNFANQLYKINRLHWQKKSNISNYTSETAYSTLMNYILEKKNEENLEEKKESNAIDQFFLSMCSTVKQFSPYNQHLAKTKIVSIVSELELKNLRNMQQQQLFHPHSQSMLNFDLQPLV